VGEQCGKVTPPHLLFSPSNSAPFLLPLRLPTFPRSRKNLFQIPDPGVKKAQDLGSGSATLVVAKTGAGDFTLYRWKISARYFPDFPPATNSLLDIKSYTYLPDKLLGLFTQSTNSQ
jgi:hypothetical protein